MDLLRDSTGRPGPSTWEAGHYPGRTGGLSGGRGELVRGGGVRGIRRQEPAGDRAVVSGGAECSRQIHHSRRAIFRLLLRRWASTPGVGPLGTYDMAGNVAEWCRNESGGGARYLSGRSLEHRRPVSISSPLRAAAVPSRREWRFSLRAEHRALYPPRPWPNGAKRFGTLRRPSRRRMRFSAFTRPCTLRPHAAEREAGNRRAGFDGLAQGEDHLRCGVRKGAYDGLPVRTRARAAAIPDRGFLPERARAGYSQQRDAWRS